MSVHLFIQDLDELMTQILTFQSHIVGTVGFYKTIKRFMYQLQRRICNLLVFLSPCSLLMIDVTLLASRMPMHCVYWSTAT